MPLIFFNYLRNLKYIEKPLYASARILLLKTKETPQSICLCLSLLFYVGHLGEHKIRTI